jgi:hypothetical protein
MFRKLIIVLALILISSFGYTEETDYLTIQTQDYTVNINSPIAMELNSEFTINPESIVIRENQNLNIVSGQAIIFRYDFSNKLDYSVIGRYELSLGIEDLTQLKNLGIYVSESLTDVECVSKNGEILKYNNQRITVNQGQNTFNLCSSTKTMSYYLDKDKLILEMVLEPGTNSIYFLFVTTPTFSLVDSSFNFRDTVKLKNSSDVEFFDLNGSNTPKSFGPVTTINKLNSEELKEIDAYNNRETYSKVNPNYNVANPKTKEVVDSPKQETLEEFKETAEQLKIGADNIKSKATALITMTPSKWGLVIFGVLAVIALSLFIYNKREKNLSNVN